MNPNAETIQRARRMGIMPQVLRRQEMAALRDPVAKPHAFPQPVCIHCGEPVEVDDVLEKWVHTFNGYLTCTVR